MERREEKIEELFDLLNSNREGYLICTTESPADVPQACNFMNQLIQDIQPSAFKKIYEGRWIYLDSIFIDIIPVDKLDLALMGRDLTVLSLEQ